MRRELALMFVSMGAAACNLVAGIEPWQAGPSGSGGAASTSSATNTAVTATATASSTSSDVSTSATGSDTSSSTGPAATCFDGLQNQDESDVDCGGDACPACQLAARCGVANDCASGACAAGFCAVAGPAVCPPNPDPQQPTCADCVQDGAETDADCGGDACPPCALTKACVVDTDCMSGACVEARCAPASVSCQPVDPDNPSCADCVKDGGETDRDCGGDACPPCADGKACLVDSDCSAHFCLSGVCTPGAN